MFGVGRRGRTAVLLGMILMCAAPPVARAAPPSTPGVDTSYGEGGIARLDAQVPPGYRLTRYPGGSALAAPGGAALVVADLTTCPEPALASGCDVVAVRRIGPGGRLDRSYGEGGLVRLGHLVAAPGLRPATGVDRRGRLLTAEDGHGTLRVRRFTAKGRIDRRFGHSGTALVRGIDLAGRVEAVLAAPRGRIVVAVAATPVREFVRPAVRVTLVRLLPDGRLDRRYGRRGKAILGIASSFGVTLHAAPGGATLVVAHNCCSSDSFTPVERVSARGRVDVRFDREARRAEVKALAGFSEPSVESVVARRDGTIELVGGSQGVEMGPGFALRLTAAGRADVRFGAGGLVRLGPGATSAVGGAGGGGLVLFHTYPDGRPGQLRVERLLADGRPDRRFELGAGAELPEAGGGELIASAGGRALLYGDGARNCQVLCEAAPYLVRLVEPAVRGGAGKGRGHR